MVRLRTRIWMTDSRTRVAWSYRASRQTDWEGIRTPALAPRPGERSGIPTAVPAGEPVGRNTETASEYRKFGLLRNVDGSNFSVQFLRKCGMVKRTHANICISGAYHFLVSVWRGAACVLVGQQSVGVSGAGRVQAGQHHHLWADGAGGRHHRVVLLQQVEMPCVWGRRLWCGWVGAAQQGRSPSIHRLERPDEKVSLHLT